MLGSPRALSEALRLDRQFQKAVFEVEQHAGLLNRQLSRGRLTQPFDREPSDGPVGNLPSHVLAEWKASMRPNPLRRFSQASAKTSPKAGLVPKTCMSDSPVLRSGHLSLHTQSANTDQSKHRRSVSAQASLYRGEEKACLMPQHVHMCVDTGHQAPGATSSPLIQPVQTATHRTRSQIQPQAQFRSQHVEMAENLRAHDMHRMVQQCQHLLRSRTDTHSASSQKHASGRWQPQSRRRYSELEVPDIKVQLRGVNARHDTVQSPRTKLRAFSQEIGQIGHCEPPPAFSTAISSSSYRRPNSNVPALQSDRNTESSFLRQSGQMEYAFLQSSSVASSPEQTKMASTTCSTDSSMSKLGGRRSPEVEQKALSVHPNILRAHLDRMHSAEKDMERSCSIRW